MADYATVNDVITLLRPLTSDEQTRAAALIPLVTASLNTEAKKVGKDLPAMVSEDEDLALVAKEVTVNAVGRMLNTSTRDEAMSQFTQSAMGYSVTGTPLSSGGGIFFKRAELARLGLRNQRYGGIDLYGCN